MNEIGRQVGEQYAYTAGFTGYLSGTSVMLGYQLVLRIRNLSSKRFYIFNPVLVCDDFGGYKASFELHATNKSQLAEQALRHIQLLYEIESEVRDLEPDLRCRIRQEKPYP